MTICEGMSLSIILFVLMSITIPDFEAALSSSFLSSSAKTALLMDPPHRGFQGDIGRAYVLTDFTQGISVSLLGFKTYISEAYLWREDLGESQKELLDQLILENVYLMGSNHSLPRSSPDIPAYNVISAKRNPSGKYRFELICGTTLAQSTVIQDASSPLDNSKKLCTQAFVASGRALNASVFFNWPYSFTLPGQKGMQTFP